MGRFQPAAGKMNPDGRLLAVWSHEDETNIFVLDARTGDTIATLQHPDLVGLEIAWHPNGRLLATGCNDNQVYIWDAVAGRRVRVLEAHKGTPVSAAFSHDGKLLASSGWDQRTILWDVESGRQLVSIGIAGFVSFAPNDRSIVLCNWDLCQLWFLEVAYGQEVRTIYEQGRVPGAPNGWAMFSASGQWLAYDKSGGAAIYDVAAQREIGSIAGRIGLCGFGELDQSLIGVRYSADARGQALRLSLGTNPNDEATAIELKESQIPTVSGVPSCLSLDRKLCVVLNECRAHVVRTDTFVEQACTGLHTGMTWVALSPDNKLLATGPFHGYEVKVWDAATGSLVKDLPILPDVATVAFSPDGQWLVVGEWDKYQFWKVGTWTPDRSIPRMREFVPMMAFSADSRILAGTSQFIRVVLFNAATGEELAELEPQNPWQVTRIDFSPDGTQLAICEGHSALRIWDLRAIQAQLARMRLDWKPPQPVPDSASSGTKSQKTSGP